jgi:hypothetical protein
MKFQKDCAGIAHGSNQCHMCTASLPRMISPVNWTRLCDIALTQICTSHTTCLCPKPDMCHTVAIQWTTKLVEPTTIAMTCVVLFQTLLSVLLALDARFVVSDVLKLAAACKAIEGMSGMVLLS